MSEANYRYEYNDVEDRYEIYGGVNVIGSADLRDHAAIWINALNHPACGRHSIATVKRFAHTLRVDLLKALPREDDSSEGMQHALIAHALLQQVDYHLELASMKGVR